MGLCPGPRLGRSGGPCAPLTLPRRRAVRALPVSGSVETRAKFYVSSRITG